MIATESNLTMITDEDDIVAMQEFMQSGKISLDYIERKCNGSFSSGDSVEDRMRHSLSFYAQYRI
jgi:hypothetical protein